MPLVALILGLAAAAPAQANVTIPGLNDKIGFSSFRDFPEEQYFPGGGGGGGAFGNGNGAHCGETGNPDTGGDFIGGATRCGEELYSINPDGSGETRMTTNSRLDGKFSWNPLIGAPLNFESRVGCEQYFNTTVPLGTDGSCFADIFSMPAAGGGATQLTTSRFLDVHGSYSPDGSKIAFESERVVETQPASQSPNGVFGDGVFQQRAIYTMSSAGESAGAAVKLVPELPELPDGFDSAISSDLTPAWSPDASRIAFTRMVFAVEFQEEEPDPELMGKIAGALDRLQDGDLQPKDLGSVLGGGIGPSEKAPEPLAFLLSLHTYVAPASGGAAEPLGEPTACLFGNVPLRNGFEEEFECNLDRHPAWTPDGSRILLDRIPAFSFVDIIERAEKPADIFPTDKDIVALNAADGTQLANLSDATEDPDCGEIPPKGQDFVPCTEDVKPAPSPDGTKVAFHSDRACSLESDFKNDPFLQMLNAVSPCFDIWTMNADGSSPVRLTQSPEADWNADWRRTEPAATPVAQAAAPAPAAKTPARPSARIAGLRSSGCTASARVRVPIRVTAEAGVRSVRVSLDGKRIKSSTKSRFTVFVNAKKLKSGRHRLTVTVIDDAGNRRTVTRRFARCAQARPRARRRAAPRFTG